MTLPNLVPADAAPAASTGRAGAVPAPTPSLPLPAVEAVPVREDIDVRVLCAQAVHERAPTATQGTNQVLSEAVALLLSVKTGHQDLKI